jgi:hypothetical protein
MHGPTIKSGNHPFRSAARVVQCQLREYLENRPQRGFAHVGVELGIPAESAGHTRPNASVADPCFQRNCCDASCLDIKCDGDVKPCQRGREGQSKRCYQQGLCTPAQPEVDRDSGGSIDGPSANLFFLQSVIDRLIRHRTITIKYSFTNPCSIFVA